MLRVGDRGMGRGRGRGRGTYCRSHTIVTPQWSRHLHPALHPPAPLRSVYDHLSFLAQPCGGQGPHDQCPCDTCPHGIGTGVQGLPPACHNIDIDRDPDHLCKMVGGLLLMLFIQQGLGVTTRTHLHILINLTIWLEDRGDSPTTTRC